MGAVPIRVDGNCFTYFCVAIRFGKLVISRWEAIRVRFKEYIGCFFLFVWYASPVNYFSEGKDLIGGIANIFG